MYCYDGFSEQNATAIVACEDGSLSEIPLPERASSNIGASFSLSVEKRSLLFKSIKSELLRADEQREIDRKKQEKLDRKIVEMEKVKTDNPNLDIDESLFLSEFKAIINVYIYSQLWWIYSFKNSTQMLQESNKHKCDSGFHIC